MIYNTSDDIKRLGTILGIWAHPDDESWLMGGVIATALSNGQRVVCITATTGQAGQTADEARWPQAELDKIRTQELDAAMAALGGGEHFWLDYKDGQLINADAETAANNISQLIREVNPDTIITFGADGLTGHDDHKTVHAWTKAAMQKAGSTAKLLCGVETKETYESIGRICDQKFNIYFKVAEPLTVAMAEADLCFCPGHEAAAKKTASIKAHASQTSALFDDPDGLEFIRQCCQCESFMEEKV